jgi:hypothetical protein
MEKNTLIHKPVRVPRAYARDVTADVMAFKNLKPDWFAEYSWRFNVSDEDAITEFRNYCIRVARQTGSHILPVYSLGRIAGKGPHIHAALCAERHLKYSEVHIWRSGVSEQKLYDRSKPGIEYLCDYSRSHKFVMGVYPYCPRKGSCRRRGCVYQRGREY